MTNPLSNESRGLQWDRARPPSAAALSCPVCQSHGPHARRLTAPSLADGSPISAYECKSCASCFADPPEIHDFSEIFGAEFAFPKHYCEVTAGLWEMYWPVALAPAGTDASLLDVGCGFGFTVDTWRTLRGPAIGVELAPYGKIGARALGIEIHFELLRDIDALRGRKFDVVYASEVIEHVPDPVAFVGELARFIGDAGTLVLTTPNANFIRVENDSPTLISALSPGFHGFLFSPQALASVVRQGGFTHVVVREFNERLVAWASRQPLKIPTDNKTAQSEFLEYLKTSVEKRAEIGDYVYDGFAYRLLRDLVRLGQSAQAENVRLQLKASLARKYPLPEIEPHPRPPHPGAAQGGSAPSTLSASLQNCPGFLPNYWFFCGLLASNHAHDAASAARYFGAAWRWTTGMVGTYGPIPFLEAISLIVPARISECQALAMLGEYSCIVEFINDWAQPGWTAPNTLGFASTSRERFAPILTSLLNVLIDHQRVLEIQQVQAALLAYYENEFSNPSIAVSSSAIALTTLDLFTALAKALRITDPGSHCARGILQSVVTEASKHQPFSVAGRDAARVLSTASRILENV